MALKDFIIAGKTSRARKELGDYSRKAGRAIGKQSKWANLGRQIGSAALPKLAAMAIGGPIGILGGAAMAGVGSYLGGKWGREGAEKTKGGKVGKLAEGNWAKGSRASLREDVKDMRSMLKEQNMSSAITAGAMAGAKGFKDAGGFKAITGTGKETFDAAGNVVAAPTVKDVFSKESLFGGGVQKGSLVDKLGGTLKGAVGTTEGFLDKVHSGIEATAQDARAGVSEAIYGKVPGQSGGVAKKGLVDLGYDVQDFASESLGRLDEGVQILGSEIKGRGKQYIAEGKAAVGALGDQLHGAIRQTGENVVSGVKSGVDAIDRGIYGSDVLTGGPHNVGLGYQEGVVDKVRNIGDSVQQGIQAGINVENRFGTGAGQMLQNIYQKGGNLADAVGHGLSGAEQYVAGGFDAVHQKGRGVLAGLYDKYDQYKNRDNPYYNSFMGSDDIKHYNPFN